MTEHPGSQLDRPDADPFEVAASAAAVLRERTGVAEHDVAIVLGSGWVRAGARVGEVVATLDQTDLPGFVPAAVPGQSGLVSSVAVGDTGRRALVFGGRTHLYEGRGVRAAVHPIRTAAAAGARVVILTNGCGALQPQWLAGTVALVSDHLNLTGVSPVEGPQFVDLTDLYSSRLRALVHAVEPGLPEGVYVQLRGPHYETPAEVAMVRVLGGDLIGMSTAVEAIAARQCGVEVLGLSLVTNVAAGLSSHPLSHEEVLRTGHATSQRCARLLADVLARLAVSR